MNSNNQSKNQPFRFKVGNTINKGPQVPFSSQNGLFSQNNQKPSNPFLGNQAKESLLKQYNLNFDQYEFSQKDPYVQGNHNDENFNPNSQRSNFISNPFEKSIKKQENSIFNYMNRQEIACSQPDQFKSSIRNDQDLLIKDEESKIEIEFQPQQPVFQHSLSQPISFPTQQRSTLFPMNTVADRFIPPREANGNTDLQDLLMNLSFDDSANKQSSGTSLESQTQGIVDPQEFKNLLASQLVQRAQSQKKTYHTSLSQTHIVENHKHHQPLTNSQSGILPSKLLSFTKDLNNFDRQFEDGKFVFQDKFFQQQFQQTRKCFSSQNSINEEGKTQIKFNPRPREFPLPVSPFKIFEAPNIVPDKRLNLLDWGPQYNPFDDNQKIVIALQEKAYLINPLKGQNELIAHLDNSQTQKYICSVNFDRSGEALAVGTSDKLIQIYDVEKKQQIRSMKGQMGRVTCISWNRSILSPYLITSAGSDGLIMNHDVRIRDSQICVLATHPTEVISLQWSTNQSYQLMRQSDHTSIYLASTSMGHDLAIWKYNELQQGCNDRGRVNPWHYDDTSFQGNIKALAWSPSYEGQLAVGGGQKDNIIRLYNFKQTKDIVHSIECRTPITSLAWRKGKIKSNKEMIIEDLKQSFCEELISTHGQPDFEIKLWQVNKYQNPLLQESNGPVKGIPLKFWFTKVREWLSHTNDICGSAISPDGQYMATLGLDETLRVWHMFEKIEDDEYSHGHNPHMNKLQTQSSHDRRSTSKKKFQRQDSQLLKKSLSNARNIFKMHSTINLQQQIQEMSSYQSDDNYGYSQNSIR